MTNERFRKRKRSSGHARRGVSKRPGLATEAGRDVCQTLRRPDEVPHQAFNSRQPLDSVANSAQFATVSQIVLFKYQALGNDYLVLDLPGALDEVIPLLPRICDRHFGVGSDGLLAFDPETGTPAPCGDAIADPVTGVNAALVALACRQAGGPWLADLALREQVAATLDPAC